MTAAARPPVDLRLAPAALAGWLAAWWATGEARGVVLVAGVAAAAAAGVALVASRCLAEPAGSEGRARAAGGPRSRSTAPSPGPSRDDEAAARAAAGRSHGSTGRPGESTGPSGRDARAHARGPAGRRDTVTARRGRFRAAAPGAALALGAVGLLLAATSVQLAVRDAGGLARRAQAGDVVTVVGVVRDDPQVLASPWGGDPLVLVSVDARSVAAAGATAAVRTAAPVLVRGSARWADVLVGQRVRVTGRLRPADPGEREVAEVTPDGPPDVVGAPHGPVAVADALRRDLMAVTDDLSPQARALVPGVAVGDVSRLDPDLAAAMRTVGLTHVTAVSGGHFAIVVAALTGVCTALRLGRWARVGVLAPATAGFVLLVRPDPSVVRSAAMCACALVALALARPSRALPALCASVLVLLVCDPWLARSFGFVLSAAATAGIVVGAGPVAARLAAWVPRPLALAVAVPTVAQAACGPVLVLLAPTVGLYTVPANLVAEPALVPATVLGVLATLVAPWWPTGAHLLAMVSGWATGWLAATATCLAALPGAQLAWLPGGPGAVLLALATAAAGTAAWQWRWAARAVGVRVPWERGGGWPGGPPWAAHGRLRGCLPLLARRPARPHAARRARRRDGPSPSPT